MPRFGNLGSGGGLAGLGVLPARSARTGDLLQTVGASSCEKAAAEMSG